MIIRVNKNLMKKVVSAALFVSVSILPDLHPLIRIKPHFITFFNVEGFIKLGNIGKRPVYAHKTRGVLVG